jgi:hypothetical protein
MADLYTDNDVSIPLVNRLQLSGHDVVTVRDLGTRKAGDDEHLLTAAVQRRIFITHNGRDFLLHHNAWRRWAAAWGATAQHAGVLVIPQRVPIARLEIEILALLASAHAMANILYHWSVNHGRQSGP